MALLRGDAGRAETWFYRGIVTSLGLFVLFSMADQVFGDRFQLLEHGLFWMVLLASWIAFKFFAVDESIGRLGIGQDGSPPWCALDTRRHVVDSGFLEAKPFTTSTSLCWALRSWKACGNLTFHFSRTSWFGNKR